MNTKTSGGVSIGGSFIFNAYRNFLVQKGMVDIFFSSSRAIFLSK